MYSFKMIRVLLLQCLCVFTYSYCEINTFVGWEDGTLSSGLEVPMIEGYSINQNSSVKDSTGERYSANELHFVEAIAVPWAKEGDYVLKVYADGRNYGTEENSAWRAEMSFLSNEYKYSPGDEQYYSMSFWPDESWNQEGTNSTIISQWKMNNGGPHATLKLSNEGDFAIVFKIEFLE